MHSAAAARTKSGEVPEPLFTACAYNTTRQKGTVMHSAPGAAQPAPTHPDGPQAALANLAAEFSDQDFDVTLNPADEEPPSMTVASRHAQLSETIYADDR